MSSAARRIRGCPRWSMSKLVAPPASSAGESGSGGMVLVGPPKFPSGESFGSPLVMLFKPVHGPKIFSPSGAVFSVTMEFWILELGVPKKSL